ncbi:MAG: ribosome-associated translation inhibitor RaiA [Elusimicrobia bacterium]|nr:ribosome-associated translation inhibitor RaiA [Candidatus Liberimonas magnetica]
MQINISARHLKLTNPIADYIQKKVERCEKYFDHIVWAQVIISVEKHRQLAEIVIHAKKITFRSKEESTDLYAAIDLALDKIEKQLKKHKEIVKNIHKQKTSMIQISDLDKLDFDLENFGKNIDEIKQYDIKTLSVEEAIREMIKIKDKFYMFNNIETSKINVVYLKDQNSYGLIRPKK